MSMKMNSTSLMTLTFTAQTESRCIRYFNKSGVLIRVPYHSSTLKHK